MSDWSSDVCSSGLIAEMAALQTDLLARAARWVKPGGTLVYATCSLERAESEDQIAAFLTRHADWTVDPVRPDELPDANKPDPTGFLRTRPSLPADAAGLAGFLGVRVCAPSDCTSHCFQPLRTSNTRVPSTSHKKQHTH